MIAREMVIVSECGGSGGLLISCLIRGGSWDMHETVFSCIFPIARLSSMYFRKDSMQTIQTVREERGVNHAAGLFYENRFHRFRTGFSSTRSSNRVSPGVSLRTCRDAPVDTIRKDPEFSPAGGGERNCRSLRYRRCGKIFPAGRCLTG